MSVELLERAAASLGPLLDEVAFLGGASLALWMTDRAAPDPRITLDVDVIVVINTRLGYYAFGERLRRQGFTDDAESGIVCRWRRGAAPGFGKPRTATARAGSDRAHPAGVGEPGRVDAKRERLGPDFPPTEGRYRVERRRPDWESEPSRVYTAGSVVERPLSSDKTSGAISKRF